MLKRLQKLLEARLADLAPATPARDDLLQLVTAALLIETARADYARDPREYAAIEQLVSNHFDLGPEATADLLAEADSRVDGAVSLYEFTRQLNEHLDEKQKLDVLEMMWRVAHADGTIDKYEEHLLRRVADLLHLRHQDFVRLRHHTASKD